MNKQWLAQHSMYMDRYELLCLERDGDRRFYLEAEFTKIESVIGTYPCAPTIALCGDEAQQIMNALWDTGLRPNNGAGAVAHTEAMDKHLDDMRRIVASKLKVDLK